MALDGGSGLIFEIRVNRPRQISRPDFLASFEFFIKESVMPFRHKSALLVIAFIFACLGIVSAQSGPDNPASAPAMKNTGIFTGQFKVKGEGTMAGGQVSFYNALIGPPPSPKKYARLPDIIKKIDTDSKFSAEVPAGTYYILAFKRSASGLGLPGKGDLKFRVRDEKGVIKAHIIKEGENIDLGVLEVDPLRKIDRTGTAADLQVTSLEGVITDSDGKPVVNELVYAFQSPKKGERPIFVSERSDNAGKYVLRTTEGSYYLRVRKELGDSGAPAAGQLIDSYGEKEPVHITVKKNEKKTGIDLKVEKFPGKGPFQGKGPKYGKGPKENTVIKPARLGKPPAQGKPSGKGAAPGQNSAPAQDTAPKQNTTPKEDTAPRQDTAPREDTAPRQ